MTDAPDPASRDTGSSGAKHLTNLQTRLVSAVVLAIVVLGLSWLGGVGYRLLVVAVAATLFYEWTTMRRRPTGVPHRLLAWLCVAAALACVLADPAPGLLFGVILAAALLVAAHGLWADEGLWNAWGVAYTAFSAATLALIRDGGEAGLLLLLFLFAIVWATDALAYFVGRAVGGPKLAPAISPGKTWSGAFGGAAGGTLAGAAIAVLTGWGSVWIVALALLLSVASQLGDLLESLLKRRQGVKDSSHIIPGHGGFMDRIDGLVAAAWVLYVIGVLFGGADNPASGLVVG